MNYRHIFHAGNAVDVVKHAILALLIERLKAKPTAFCVLDTHAGIGRYDLRSAEALKTREFEEGIGALFTAESTPSDLVPYLDAVRAANPDGRLRWYPGSPALVHQALRPNDRLVLIELHPEDHEALKRVFARDPAVAVHKMDAYDALKAHLPPREKRGLVLIDPPFESPDEFTRMAAALAKAHRRWPTGVYALWYPIKERAAVWRFHEAVEKAGIPRVLVAELTTHPDDTHQRLNGCGMLIVNPPWRLDAALRTLLPAIHAQLPGTGGGARVDWLAPEAPA